METPREWIDAGAWVGRQQAFAMIANGCSAAQALCLKQVRETRLYAGISRENADLATPSTNGHAWSGPSRTDPRNRA
jgi:hypothetical protein